MTRTASLVAALLLLAPVATQAYYVESVSHADGGAQVIITWDTSAPVEFRAAPSTYPADVPGITEAIAAAFQTWTDVECSSIVFTQGPDDATATPMHWRDTDEIYILVFFMNDPAVWGSTPRVGRFDWVHDGTGNLVAAEIILNSKDHTWSTTGEAGKLDVQSIVTALAGRSLGITSTMEGNATYPSYLAGDTSKRTLGTDDIAAVQYVYPEDGCAGMGVDPEAVCTPGDALCPPEVVTMPGDGGTSMPPDGGPAGGDSGPPVRGDGGVTTDDDDDGGCCSVAAGASSRNERGAWLAIGFVALLLGWRLRRR